jgi:hypothetical protein
MVLEIHHEGLEFHEVGQAGEHIQQLVVDLLVAALEQAEESAHIEVFDGAGQLLNHNIRTFVM